MSIMRYDPFDALTPFREAFNRMIDEGMLGVSRFEPFGRVFPLDIRETATNYVVEAAIPGVKPEEIHVTATGSTLTIQVTRKPEEKTEKPEKADTYFRRERYLGEMSRVIELPFPIEAADVTATYEHGILTLHVPKAAESEPVKIPVKVTEPAIVH
jgi:HSP20 family protein